MKEQKKEESAKKLTLYWHHIFIENACFDSIKIDIFVNGFEMLIAKTHATSIFNNFFFFSKVNAEK